MYDASPNIAECYKCLLCLWVVGDSAGGPICQLLSWALCVDQYQQWSHDNIKMSHKDAYDITMVWYSMDTTENVSRSNNLRIFVMLSNYSVINTADENEHI